MLKIKSEDSFPLSHAILSKGSMTTFVLDSELTDKIEEHSPFRPIHSSHKSRYLLVLTLD